MLILKIALLLGMCAYSVQGNCNNDFEEGKKSLKGWIKTGDAFNNQPTYGDNPLARNKKTMVNQNGDYWLGTYEDRPNPDYPPGGVQRDTPTGTLTSPEFTINGSDINFLIGGGCDESKVRVELLIDGSRVKSATGKCHESMERVHWPVGQYIGRKGRIRLIDNYRGPWGHLNFDDFRGDFTCGKELDNLEAEFKAFDSKTTHGLKHRPTESRKDSPSSKHSASKGQLSSSGTPLNPEENLSAFTTPSATSDTTNKVRDGSTQAGSTITVPSIKTAKYSVAPTSSGQIVQKHTTQSSQSSGTIAMGAKSWFTPSATEMHKVPSIKTAKSSGQIVQKHTTQSPQSSGTIAMGAKSWFTPSATEMHEGKTSVKPTSSSPNTQQNTLTSTQRSSSSITTGTESWFTSGTTKTFKDKETTTNQYTDASTTRKSMNSPSSHPTIGVKASTSNASTKNKETSITGPTSKFSPKYSHDLSKTTPSVSGYSVKIGFDSTTSAKAPTGSVSTKTNERSTASTTSKTTSSYISSTGSLKTSTVAANGKTAPTVTPTQSFSVSVLDEDLPNDTFSIKFNPSKASITLQSTEDRLSKDAKSKSDKKIHSNSRFRTKGYAPTRTRTSSKPLTSTNLLDNQTSVNYDTHKHPTTHSTTSSHAEDGKVTSASSTLSSKSSPTKSSTGNSRPTEEESSNSDSDDVTIQISHDPSDNRKKFKVVQSNKASYYPSKSTSKTSVTKANFPTLKAKTSSNNSSSTVKKLNEKDSVFSSRKRKLLKHYNGTALTAAHTTTKSSIIPKQEEFTKSDLKKFKVKKPSGNSSGDASEELIEDIVDMLFTNATDNNLDKSKMEKNSSEHTKERVTFNKKELDMLRAEFDKLNEAVNQKQLTGNRSNLGQIRQHSNGTQVIPTPGQGHLNTASHKGMHVADDSAKPKDEGLNKKMPDKLKSIEGLIHTSKEEKHGEMTQYTDGPTQERPCSVKFVRVGCYADKQSPPRPLNDLLFDENHHVDRPRNFRRSVCRCAEETKRKKYNVFGIQFYGQCWSGKNGERTYGIDKSSNNCFNNRLHICSDSDKMCVGGPDTNFVYRIESENGENQINDATLDHLDHLIDASIKQNHRLKIKRPRKRPEYWAPTQSPTSYQTNIKVAQALTVRPETFQDVPSPTQPPPTEVRQHDTAKNANYVNLVCKQFLVELLLTVPWHDDFTIPSSRKYWKLRHRVEPEILKLYGEDEDFLGVHIERFRPAKARIQTKASILLKFARNGTFLYKLLTDAPITSAACYEPPTPIYSCPASCPSACAPLCLSSCCSGTPIPTVSQSYQPMSYNPYSYSYYQQQQQQQQPYQVPMYRYPEQWRTVQSYYQQPMRTSYIYPNTQAFQAQVQSSNAPALHTQATDPNVYLPTCPSDCKARCAITCPRHCCLSMVRR